MTGPRIGSLFSGYGGLDMGVQAVLGGEVAWHVEYDAAPSRILEHHWPDIPNYGDITQVDFAAVEPVEMLTGGFPCQDLSLAGRRAGMRPGTRSGLWADYLRAINTIRPQLAVIENVRGLLSGCAESDLEPCPGCVGDGEHRPVLRALGRVLGDLADIGYDAEWVGVRAADAGAPHGRFRVFVLAHPHHGPGDGEWSRPVLGRRSEAVGGGIDATSDARSERLGEHPGAAPQEETGPRGGDIATGDRGSRSAGDWGPYRPAITRWENTTGRHAPAPTRGDGRDNAHRLNPAFVEWMMGLPEGHVTDPAIGISRAEQLKALGNGVVPQQAALAIRTLLGVAA